VRHCLHIWYSAPGIAQLWLLTLMSHSGLQLRAGTTWYSVIAAMSV
jgi:hypothetical protein